MFGSGKFENQEAHGDKGTNGLEGFHLVRQNQSTLHNSGREFQDQARSGFQKIKPEYGVLVLIETVVGCSSGIPTLCITGTRQIPVLFETKVSEKNVKDPLHEALALTQLGEFLIAREVKEVSMPNYDPNRNKLKLESFTPSCSGRR